MNSITNDLTQKQSSPLDEFLKARGVNQAQENGLQQEEDTSTQSMTIAHFSAQSIVMANANNTQNSLLASVMGAASSSTAETSSERTAFGKQTAVNMLQSMEKDNFEQNVSDLLEGLRTDIEEAAEEKLNEATGLEDPTSLEETSIVEETITAQGEQPSTSSATTQTAVTTAQVVTEAQSAGAAPAAEATPSAETSGEAAEPAKAPAKSVDTYV